MSGEVSDDPKRSLFYAVVTHPVAVGMLFLAGLVFGSISYQRLALELMPDISYPTITVRTVYEGAAPQEVETQVTRPIEEALATTDGLVRMESRSRPGLSDVQLGFSWGTDLSRASQSIREQLQVAPLPEQVERPLILKYDPTLEPFLRVALSGPEPEEGDSFNGEGQRLLRLREVAEMDLERHLEGLRGLAAVKVGGGFEREIRIEIREDWLTARQLDPSLIETTLKAENINVAGGSVIEGEVEFLVRTLNEFTSVEELDEVILRRADGTRIRLGDVAEVVETTAERQMVTQLNGQEAVEIELYKEAEANVVDVANSVHSLLYGDGRPKEWGGKEGLVDQLPEGYNLTLLDDQAAFIESAILNLRNAALMGGFLSILVLFLFLRDVRSTLIIGLSIPVSIILSLAPLYVLGVSLNLMSLGGLALGVGMLVDNAVVVLESIHRFREEGRSRQEAAVRGVGHVALAVTASTLTTVAVFLPIQFVDGVAGELFGDLSLAVVSALLASLVVALFLVPTMAAIEGNSEGLVKEEAGEEPALSWREKRAILWGRSVREPWLNLKASNREGRRWLWPWRAARSVGEGLVGFLSVTFWGLSVWGVTKGLGLARGVLKHPSRWADAAAGQTGRWFQRGAVGYERLLAGVLLRPVGVMMLALALAVGAMGLGTQLGTELLPTVHQGRFLVDLTLPVGTPLDQTVSLAEEVQVAIMERSTVESVYARIGTDGTADADSDEGEHTSRLSVQLKPHFRSAFVEDTTMVDVRELLQAWPEVDTTIHRPAMFSLRMPLEVYLFGYELDVLEATATRLVDALSALPGLRDVHSSLKQGYPEVRIEYDRERLFRLGLNPRTVAEQVRDKIQGKEASRLRREDLRIPLKVQLAEGDRSTVEDLRRLNVNPNLQPVIPLDAVASLKEGRGPSEIRRLDQQRVVTVSAGLKGFDLGGSADAVATAVEDLNLPESLTWQVSGQSSEMQASLTSLWSALALAIFLVYVVMASTFEHLLHPLVILVSIPLALVGAVLALVVVGTPVSVVVLLGSIVLVGVVVNNAIVLVDTIGRERSHTVDLDEAICRSGRLRLRPILITTCTTVVGLLPLTLGLGAGAEIQGPLALTVVGGLVSSTGLTLIVVPVLYRAVEHYTSRTVKVTA